MATVNRLDSYFTSLIQDLMVLERQPLERLQAQRDQLNIRQGVYNDVRSKLSDFQSAIKALLSTSTSFALKAGRQTAVSGVASGYTVLTASATSSAIPGTYSLQVGNLAAEQRIRSKQWTYADQALGLAGGTVTLGGAAARAYNEATQQLIANTVTAFGVDLDGSVDAGQKELGSGTYYVETRQDEGGAWQFRLVNAEGKAVSIRQHDSVPASYTSGWQAIPSGALYDTGRGLAIQFGAEAAQFLPGSRGSESQPAAMVAYTARGYALTAGASDSLNSIAAKINSGVYAEGMGVVATIVDNMLVLSAEKTGTAHKIVTTHVESDLWSQLGFIETTPDLEDQDATDLFTHTLQRAVDASFTVNNVTVTRSVNSGLTDVIGGVTLNLAADAAGQAATLTVGADWSPARAAVDDFLATFNAVQAYLQEKTSVAASTSGGGTTYTRGALADENIFSELRGDLFYTFMSNFETGIFKNLREIGLSIDDNLQATVSDSARLEAALAGNLSGVSALLDPVMAALDTRLSRFTGGGGEEGYLSRVTSSFTSQVSEIDSEVTNLTARLTEKEQWLTDQYAQMQAQLLILQYTQQMWAGIYGKFNLSA